MGRLQSILCLISALFLATPAHSQMKAHESGNVIDKVNCGIAMGFRPTDLGALLGYSINAGMNMKLKWAIDLPMDVEIGGYYREWSGDIAVTDVSVDLSPRRGLGGGRPAPFLFLGPSFFGSHHSAEGEQWDQRDWQMGEFFSSETRILIGINTGLGCDLLTDSPELSAGMECRYFPIGFRSFSTGEEKSSDNMQRLDLAGRLGVGLAVGKQILMKIGGEIGTSKTFNTPFVDNWSDWSSLTYTLRLGGELRF